MKVRASRLPLPGVGGPAAAKEPARLTPQREVIPEPVKSEGVGRRAHRCLPAERGCVPRGAQLQQQNTASRKLFQGAPEGQGLRLAESRARAPAGFPGRQPVLGFRGGTALGRWGRSSLLSAPSLGGPCSAPCPTRQPEPGVVGPLPRRPCWGQGQEPGRGQGPAARSPRSSRPSLNWPLWLIRNCCPSSGCGGSRAGGLSGPGAAAKGAWPRVRGGATGPGGLRRSLPAAVSMARDCGSQRRR